MGFSNLSRQWAVSHWDVHTVSLGQLRTGWNELPGESIYTKLIQSAKEELSGSSLPCMDEKQPDTFRLFESSCSLDSILVVFESNTVGLIKVSKNHLTWYSVTGCVIKIFFETFIFKRTLQNVWKYRGSVNLTDLLAPRVIYAGARTSFGGGRRYALSPTDARCG